jgi:hypothetical protein
MRQRFLPKSLVALGILAAGLSACNSSSSAPVGPPPTPVACGTSIPSLAVAYPAPGASGIPSNLQGIIFSSSVALPATAQAWLAPTSAQPSPAAYLPADALGFYPVTAAPTPYPSPFATPAYANPIYTESLDRQPYLTVNTQYNVYYNDFASSCYPQLLSTFTTGAS